MNNTENEEKKIKEILSRLDQLKTERQKFEGDWTEALEFAAPYVYNWTDLNSIPTRPKRYTSSPCNYLKILTAGIVGYSVSPNITWFKLSLENKKLLNLYGVKDWLENVEKIMYAYFAQSNMYREMNSFVMDAATIGHSVLLMENLVTENKIRYTKLVPNEIYIDVNSYDEVDTLYRTYLMTVKNVVEYFGEENLDKEILEDYKHVEKWNNRIEILQCVYPRKERNRKSKDSIDMPFAAIYIDLKNKKIIKESGYEEFPYAVFQWEKIPNYAYSSSPTQEALYDIKALNIIKKTSLQIAQNSAQPAMRVSEDIRNVNITPGGFTYVASPDQVLEPIRTGENYPITLQVLEDYKTEIKDWFYVDFFLTLQQKQGKMTATEVQELQGEKAATLTNLIVNLNSALSKIIERTFNILYKNNLLPQVPRALLDHASTMKIEFTGPLANAQKKYHTMGGTMQALQMVGPILQMFPSSGDFIDADALMKNTLEGQGMPQSVIREDDDVNKIREERLKQQMQQQQQALQMQQQQNLLNNMDKLNTPNGQNTYLNQLSQQLKDSMNG